MASVAVFCDGVIALDDGSTDNTRTLLESHPLVHAMLTNPRRETYAGWNDSYNRGKLLQACEAFAPDWILWLDADEEVPACDSVLIRPFLERQGRPDTVYGLEILRLVNDYEHYDLAKLWAYRLIPFRPGYQLPSEKLHFEPVPVQIPRSSWQRTRLRIAHAAGLTAALRQARYRKYRDADPNCEWQNSYANILAPVGHVWEIEPIPPDLDLLIPNSPHFTP